MLVVLERVFEQILLICRLFLWHSKGEAYRPSLLQRRFNLFLWLLLRLHLRLLLHFVCFFYHLFHLLYFSLLFNFAGGHLLGLKLLGNETLLINHEQHVLLNSIHDFSLQHEILAVILASEVVGELAERGPTRSIQMRVIGIPNHFIVCPIGHNPLILGVLDLEVFNELRLKISRVLANKELGFLAERCHLTLMVARLLVLVECVFIFALLLAHFAVVPVLP
jgi:hypothetical protein